MQCEKWTRAHPGQRRRRLHALLVTQRYSTAAGIRYAAPCFTRPRGQQRCRGSNRNWMKIRGHVTATQPEPGPCRFQRTDHFALASEKTSRSKIQCVVPTAISMIRHRARTICSKPKAGFALTFGTARPCADNRSLHHLRQTEWQFWSPTLAPPARSMAAHGLRPIIDRAPDDSATGGQHYRPLRNFSN